MSTSVAVHWPARPGAPQDWARLAACTARDTPAAAVCTILMQSRDVLTAAGVASRQIDTLLHAWGTGVWDDAVAEFGSLGHATDFFLGPMRVQENRPLSTGLLVTAPCPGTIEVVAAVERQVDEIGARLFGQPCSFGGRHVELHDLLFGAGPFVAAPARYIALFTPFYFGGWNDWRRQSALRRTILLSNLIRLRYERLARPLAECQLLIDGHVPSCVSCSPGALDRAFALWLTLHELIHNSGPLPLFGAVPRKLPLGLRYAGIEELRVDMTVWLALGACADLFGDEAPLARELILCDRLLRSARFGLGDAQPAGRIRKSSDGEQGALWLAHLLRTGALDARDGTLRIDTARVAACLTEIMDALYACESEAAGQGEEGLSTLLLFADGLRRRYFDYVDGHATYRAEERQVLAAWAGQPIDLRLAFS